MFHYHYLQPENMWGVFKGGSFVALFASAEEAADYCNRHNSFGDAHE